MAKKIEGWDGFYEVPQNIVGKNGESLSPRDFVDFRSIFFSFEDLDSASEAAAAAIFIDMCKGLGRWCGIEAEAIRRWVQESPTKYANADRVTHSGLRTVFQEATSEGPQLVILSLLHLVSQGKFDVRKTWSSRRLIFSVRSKLFQGSSLEDTQPIELRPDSSEG